MEMPVVFCMLSAGHIAGLTPPPREQLAVLHELVESQTANRIPPLMPTPRYTAFSVKQPWAGLLVAGVKRFEVRSWAPSTPCALLVHASKGKATGYRELMKDPMFAAALADAGMSDPAEWDQSAIIGCVFIERIWEPGRPPTRMSRQDKLLCGEGYEDLLLWEVDKAVRFEYAFPCHGKLNLWTPAPDVARDIHSYIQSITSS